MGDEGNLGQSDLSIDVLFEVLADRERREILYHLDDPPDDYASTDEIIDEIIGSMDEHQEPGAARDRLATEIHHVHIPKLTGTGITDYDPRTEELRLYEDPMLEEWLDLARECDEK